MACLVLTCKTSGANQTSCHGFILIGEYYQPYSAVFQEDDFTNIELINADNQTIIIVIDEEDSADPNPITLLICYYQQNQDGALVNLLNGQLSGVSGEGLEITRHSPLIPLYYLFSLSFHRLLQRVLLSGKAVTVHLLNPLSPDNSGPFFLMPSPGNPHTIVAHPVNGDGQVQYSNKAMLFQHTNQYNWNYCIHPHLISPHARLQFYLHRLFETRNFIITAALISLFSKTTPTIAK